MNNLSKKSVTVLCKTVSRQNAALIRLSHGEAKPRRWARWQDVPDDWVLPSKRMPDNPIYQTEKWKKLKKQQIFFQQDDGIPVWLKRGYPYNYLYWVAGVLFLYTGYSAVSFLINDCFYPPKKAKK